MHECPFCGAPSEDAERIQVDLNQNVIVVDGGVIRLSRTEAEMAKALLDKYPAIASKQYIFNNVWGALSEIEDIDSCMRAYVHRLRKQIAKTSLSIITTRTRGLRFALDVASGQMVA